MVYTFNVIAVVVNRYVIGLAFLVYFVSIHAAVYIWDDEHHYKEDDGGDDHENDTNQRELEPLTQERKIPYIHSHQHQLSHSTL